MISTIASVIGPITSTQTQFSLTYSTHKPFFHNYSSNVSPLNEFNLADDNDDEFFYKSSQSNASTFQDDLYNTSLYEDQSMANFTKSIGFDSVHNFTNISSFSDVDPQIPAYIRTTSMVFCIIIMCLGVVGNVMVPIVIMKTKDMRNSTNIFLMNLSIADLMVLLVCTPTVLVEVNTKPETWVLGKEMCLAVPFVELTVAHASVLTILAISFERYYAICEPLKAGYVCTKTRAALICFLAWFVAAVFTSPILAMAEYSEFENKDRSIGSACLTQAASFWPTLYFLMTISLFFLIPFLILLVLYTIIARNLISDASKMAVNKHVDCFNQRARRQVVMMLGTVILSFFVCLMPFKLFTLWIVIAPVENIYKLGVENYYNILYFSRTMLYLNSAINPILYNLMSSKFRDGFLLVCHLKSKQELRNYKRGQRDRMDTFRTTSSCTTSSSLSRQNTGLNHNVLIRSSCAANNCSNLSLNYISEPQTNKTCKCKRSQINCENIQNTENSIQIQDETDNVKVNSKQQLKRSFKIFFKNNSIKRINCHESSIKNQDITHRTEEENNSTNSDPTTSNPMNKLKFKESTCRRHTEDYGNEEGTDRRRGELSHLLKKQFSIDHRRSSNHSLRRSVVLKCAKSLDETDLHTPNLRIEESFV